MNNPCPIAAIFDVDRTLVRVPTEQCFFWYLLRRRRLSGVRTLAFLVTLMLHPRDRFRNKSYLAGQRVADIDALARQCYASVIAPHLSPVGRKCVRYHQQQGHRIVLLTGSLRCLIQPLQEDLGADWLLATRLFSREGIHTGAVAGLHPRGTDKLRLIQELAGTHSLDLSRSHAYADHSEDLPLLAAVGHPVAVNPSARLRLAALQRHWPIRYF